MAKEKELETPPAPEPKPVPESVDTVKSAPRIAELEAKNSELSEKIKAKETDFAKKDDEYKGLKSQHETLLNDLNKLKKIPSARNGFQTVMDEINDALWGKE